MTGYASNVTQIFLWPLLIAKQVTDPSMFFTFWVVMYAFAFLNLGPKCLGGAAAALQPSITALTKIAIAKKF